MLHHILTELELPEKDTIVFWRKCKNFNTIVILGYKFICKPPLLPPSCIPLIFCLLIIKYEACWGLFVNLTVHLNDKPGVLQLCILYLAWLLTARVLCPTLFFLSFSSMLVSTLDLKPSNLKVFSGVSVPHLTVQVIIKCLIPFMSLPNSDPSLGHRVEQVLWRVVMQNSMEISFCAGP